MLLLQIIDFKDFEERFRLGAGSALDCADGMTTRKTVKKVEAFTLLESNRLRNVGEKINASFRCLRASRRLCMNETISNTLVIFVDWIWESSPNQTRVGVPKCSPNQTGLMFQNVTPTKPGLMLSQV